MVLSGKHYRISPEAETRGSEDVGGCHEMSGSLVCFSRVNMDPYKEVKKLLNRI